MTVSGVRSSCDESAMNCFWVAKAASKPLNHGVEGTRQPAHFIVGSANLQALAQVLRRADVLRCAGDGRPGAAGPSRDKPDDRRPNQHGGCHAED